MISKIRRKKEGSVLKKKRERKTKRRITFFLS